MVGFRAVDEDVLGLLDVVQEVRNLMVVNRDQQDAIAAWHLLGKANPNFGTRGTVAAHEVTFKSGFSDFIDNDLTRFLRA